MGGLFSRIASLLAPRRHLALFGGSRTWSEVKTVAVDDAIRGGKSRSEFDVSPDAQTARFSGVLVTEILGAGFASRNLVPAGLPLPLDLSRYSGLEITTEAADGMVYSVNLKDRVAPRRPDGRLESVVEHKAFLSPPAGAGTRTVFIPFSDFKPYYRGRPYEGDAGPLDAANICTVNLMCASLFEKQKGPFSLTVSEIAASTGPSFWSRLMARL
ncbi:complex I intermediate-associated protein 30-domain-containing protein [Hyaloraphidium curvatum]|nr:complex I intermediate-associated protein 30-domain-containing protein [Hyaloraphidium curvatum]